MAADNLADEEGIDVEVVDLRTLSPLDIDTIVDSFKRTSRGAVVHEGPKTGGLGAQYSSIQSPTVSAVTASGDATARMAPTQSISGKRGCVDTMDTPDDKRDDGEGNARWWQEIISEFDAHDMPAYQPPKFSDGEIVPVVVRQLEQELESTIRIQSVNPQKCSEWNILVDGTPIGSIDRRRESEGYSLYDLPSDEFESIVREAVNDG